MRAQSDRTTYAAQYGSIYISVTVGLAGSCHFGAVGWWHAADRADRVRRAFCAAHLGEAGVCDPVRADSDVAPGLARVLPGGAPAAGRMRRRGGGGRGRADDLGDDPGVPDRRAAAPGRPGRPGPWPGPDRPDRADHPPGPDGGQFARGWCKICRRLRWLLLAGALVCGAWLAIVGNAGAAPQPGAG